MTMIALKMVEDTPREESFFSSGWARPLRATKKAFTASVRRLDREEARADRRALNAEKAVAKSADPGYKARRAFREERKRLSRELVELRAKEVALLNGAQAKSTQYMEDEDPADQLAECRKHIEAVLAKLR